MSIIVRVCIHEKNLVLSSRLKWADVFSRGGKEGGPGRRGKEEKTSDAEVGM